jgi:hypothetical protein
MIQDMGTGLFYKRGGQHYGRWVPQEEASVWTTPGGPRGCLGAIKRYNRRLGLKVLRQPNIVTIQTDKPRVILVCGDDWQGLYINGKLVEEGHNIPLDEIFKYLGIEGRSITVNDEWLQEQGRLPENLDEVEKG